MEIKIVNLDGTSSAASLIGGDPSNKDLVDLAESESASHGCHALIGTNLDATNPPDRTLNVSARQGVLIFNRLLLD